MARMNLKAGARLHNKHHIVLMDAKTGKVKQEGWAYNAILNQGFARLINAMKGSGTSADFAYSVFGNSPTLGVFGTTFIGTGTTAVNVADTAMSDYLSRKTNSGHNKSLDNVNLIASHTRKVVWDETEIQNTVITEVGLGVDNETTGLSTRALIKDSEGNQISITKGTLDILTVYSTVFIELSHSYGSNFGFIGGKMTGSYAIDGNALLIWIYDSLIALADGTAYTEWYRSPYAICVGKSSDSILFSDAGVKDSILCKSVRSDNFNGDVVYDTVNKRVKFESQGAGGPLRFGASEGNDALGIWEICAAMGFRVGTLASVGVAPIFRAVMPIAGVWPGTTITDEELGTGTGSQTVFQTTWAPVLSGTDVVKVDAVTKTRGTDYTINLATGEITFATAPGTGAAVTCTYGIEQIPKDSNHVLDISFTIQFADGGI